MDAITMKVDQRLFTILNEIGIEGIEQTAFSQRLNLPENTISDLVEPLVQAGYLDRKIIEQNGKKISWLYPIKRLENWGGIGTCPCVNCLELERCGVGQMVSPESCQDLFEWVVNESRFFQLLKE
ncbi:MAG: hypothetical protein ACW976_06420 [Candidatus Ranarchaeia archaeon]|jgi:hypothetical protein